MVNLLIIPGKIIHIIHTQISDSLQDQYVLQVKFQFMLHLIQIQQKAISSLLLTYVMVELPLQELKQNINTI